jgi:toxin secretion/phage lysis holin
LNVILEFISDFIPTQTQIEWGGVTVFVGSIFSYLCGWDSLTEYLLWFMVLDYISGLFAAYISPNDSLDSRKGYKGIVKKIMILVLVSLAHFMDQAMGQDVVQNFVVLFFMGNEGLSIVENAAKAGLPVPQALKDTLEQYQKQKVVKKG